MVMFALVGVNVWQGLAMQRRAAYARQMENKAAAIQEQLDNALRRAQEERKPASDPGAEHRTPSTLDWKKMQVRDLVSLRDAYRTSFSEAIRVWPGMTSSRRHLIDGAEKYLRQTEALLGSHGTAGAPLADAWLTLADIQGNPAMPNLHDRARMIASLREAERIAQGSPEAARQGILAQVEKLRRAGGLTGGWHSHTGRRRNKMTDAILMRQGDERLAVGAAAACDAVARSHQRWRRRGFRATSRTGICRVAPFGIPVHAVGAVGSYPAAHRAGS